VGRSQAWLASIPGTHGDTFSAATGRGACINCGFCLGFGCEVGAKSSSLATVIRVRSAPAVRDSSQLLRASHRTDASGRAVGAVYFDEKRDTHLQKAKAVIVCANGAETPRLLLLSANKQFPHGLANSSGIVGKYLMLNSGGVVIGQFEHPLNDYKGYAVSRVLHDFYELDPQEVGFYGGGGLDARFDFTPITFAYGGLPPGTPRWGKDFKAALADDFNRTMEIFCHGTSLPLETTASHSTRSKGRLGPACASPDVQRSSR